MANLCTFDMRIVGEKKNRDAFLDAVQQKGLYAVGRGACTDVMDEEENYCDVCGDTKWSIQSSLFDDAYSMQHQKMTGEGNWGPSKFIDEHEFLPLDQAAEKFGITLEAYSEEPGCQFSEHYLIDKGRVLVDECVDFVQEYIEDYESYDEFAEACSDLANEVTREEFDYELVHGDGYITRGGFPNKTFSI